MFEKMVNKENPEPKTSINISTEINLDQIHQIKNIKRICSKMNIKKDGTETIYQNDIYQLAIDVLIDKLERLSDEEAIEFLKESFHDVN